MIGHKLLNTLGGFCNQPLIENKKVYKVTGSETAHLRAETEFREGETP